MPLESVLSRLGAMAEKTDEPPRRTGGWTFLTNHAHVIICIHEDRSMLARTIAKRVGITERAVQQIISEISAAGYLARTREGRRNQYKVHADRSLRHPVEAHCLLSSSLKRVDRSHQARTRSQDRRKMFFGEPGAVA
jgi:hypothetical protein